MQSGKESVKLIVGYQNQFNLIPYFGSGPIHGFVLRVRRFSHIMCIVHTYVYKICVAVCFSMHSVLSLALDLALSLPRAPRYRKSEAKNRSQTQFLRCIFPFCCCLLVFHFISFTLPFLSFFSTFSIRFPFDEFFDSFLFAFIASRF